MKVMTNLWGFEKQVTLSRMSGGRFGLCQVAAPTPLVSTRASGYNNALQRVRQVYSEDVNLLRNNFHISPQDLPDNPTVEQFRHAIETARGQLSQIQNPEQRRQTEDRLNEMSDNLTNRYSRVLEEVARATSQISANTPNYEEARRILENTNRDYQQQFGDEDNRTRAQEGEGTRPQRRAEESSHDTELETQRHNFRMQEAEQQHRFAMEESARQTSTQNQAAATLAAAARPNDVAQVISSIMNPIAGTFSSLGTAAAMASWGGNCYSGFGPLGGVGTNPLLPMTVASTFMNGGFGCGGGFNAIGGAGGIGSMGGGFGGLDLIGMGNTFYGQALDERSRAHRLDAEINRLKAMIMMGNMDAILQAVTLLTLRSKGMLRQVGVAMINAVQRSNQQMEIQNQRLEALSSNGGSSSSNQGEMLHINNQIQGINMDRQTAMNSLRDMMSNLEEATSSEQNLRRSFEQIRQIQNRA